MTPTDKIHWLRNRNRPRLTFCQQETPPSGWGYLVQLIAALVLVIGVML